MALASIEEKEKVYLFLDWANIYREGRDLHWEKYCPYFERFEGCVPVKDINELSDSEREKYKDELEKIEKQNQKKVYLSTYFVQPEYLRSVCSRCEVNGEEPSKEQCFAFVSHPPGVSIENHPIVKILNQCFIIEYHERISWSNKREKEKGVDVALAIQIMTTIYEEKDETNLRIVIISGDTDFVPVVKKLMEPKETGNLSTKKISVEVWGWMSNMSDSYVSYLEKLEEQCSKKILHYLDDYMYQIGFTYNLERRWCTSMALANDADELICEWYEKLSYYTLVKHLKNSTEFGLETTDFSIRLRNKRIIISFLTTAARDKFKAFSAEFRGIYYYNKLYQKDYDFRQWIQKKSAASQTNKMNQSKTKAENTVNLEDDYGIIFQD